MQNSTFFFQSEMGKGKTQIGWKDKGGSVQENHPGVGLFTTSVDLVTMSLKLTVKLNIFLHSTIGTI